MRILNKPIPGNPPINPHHLSTHSGITSDAIYEGRVGVLRL